MRKAGRSLFLAAGLLLTGIGIVGVVTPGLPGTVFLIVALFCFKRSSPRLENWLLTHPRFGRILTEWEREKVVRPRIKAIAIGTMWACIMVSMFVVQSRLALAMIVVLGLVGTWYIATRRSQPSVTLAEARRGVT